MKKQLYLFSLSFIVLFTFIILFIFIISNFSGSKPSDFLLSWIKSSFLPDHNYVRALGINNISIFCYIYLILFIALFIILTIKIFMIFAFKHALYNFSVKNILFHLTIIIFIFILILQTGGVWIRLTRDYIIFSNKTTEQKYSSNILTRYPYFYAKYCKFILPGKHNADFASDLDLSKDPGSIIYRIFAYFLYPIDILKTNPEPIDSFIIFHKKDAIKYLPNDFEVMGFYNNRNVIGIKK